MNKATAQYRREANEITRSIRDSKAGVHQVAEDYAAATSAHDVARDARITRAITEALNDRLNELHRRIVALEAREG